MSKLNHIEVCLVDDKHVKTYAKVETATKKAQEFAECFWGRASARIVPAIVDGKVRYAIVFFMFSDMQDAINVARKGCYTYA